MLDDVRDSVLDEACGARPAAKAKCLETRRDGAMTMRRYRRPNGRIVKTMEIPWEIWSGVRSTAMKKLPGYERSEIRRDSEQEIKNLLAAGNKVEWIRAVTGSGLTRVMRIKKEMQK